MCLFLTNVKSRWRQAQNCQQLVPNERDSLIMSSINYYKSDKQKQKKTKKEFIV